MTSTRDSHFDMNFVFPDDLGSNSFSNFDIAFSLTGVGGTKLVDDDLRYG